MKFILGFRVAKTRHWNFMEFLARNQMISMMMKMMLTEQQKKKVRRSWKILCGLKIFRHGGLDMEDVPDPAEEN